jgi:hypothetical protein
VSTGEQSTGTGSISSASRWQHPLWIGQGAPAILWRQLIGAVVALPITNLLFTIALVAIRWPMPLKLVGVVGLLLSGGVLYTAGD